MAHQGIFEKKMKIAAALLAVNLQKLIPAEREKVEEGDQQTQSA
jgi:hypothetical protein